MLTWNIIWLRLFVLDERKLGEFSASESVIGRPSSKYVPSMFYSHCNQKLYSFMRTPICRIWRCHMDDINIIIGLVWHPCIRKILAALVSAYAAVRKEGKKKAVIVIYPNVTGMPWRSFLPYSFKTYVWSTLSLLFAIHYDALPFLFIYSLLKCYRSWIFFSSPPFQNV